MKPDEKEKGRTSRSLTFVLSLAAILGCLPSEARAIVRLNSAEGHVNFYKHTVPPDDVYTTNPSAATANFMNNHWARLMTYSGYWDQGNKLSWYPNAWAYQDAYAIYTDPSNTEFAQLIQQHPDWILRDINGNRLYIPWACGGGTCTQYAANITNPLGFRAWWIERTRTYFNRSPSYKGVFIDDVNLDLSRVGDGWGNAVTPVDPNTGQLMTNAAWRRYFADFMEQVRASLPGVEIVHNSLWFLDWTDPDIQRQIRAADWINLERGVNDAGLTGGTDYWSLDRCLRFVDNVHANGRGVILDGEPPLSDSDKAREYSAAGYLLISTGSDLVGDLSQTPSYWWTGFDTDLGKAQGARYKWQNLWRRDFAGGVALLNAPGSNSVTVALPEPFLRVDGSVLNSITLGPAEGAVLWAPAHVSALQCTPATLSSGATSICTVTLQAPAPVGGVIVAVSDTSPSLTTPASITVPSGSQSETFEASAGTILYTQTASITATLNGASLTTVISLIGSAGGTAPPPTCVVSSPTSTTPQQVSFTIRDANVGLASIVLLDSRNVQILIPSFTPGTASPVVATATQVDPSLSSSADFQATNMTGGVTTCGSSFGAMQWTPLAENASSGIVMARNTDGRLQGFFRGRDRTLWTVTQNSQGGGWLSAQSLGGVMNGDPAIGTNADGRLEVFVLGSDNSLWHIAQSSAGGAWSAWGGLGGLLISNPTVARNQDGRLEVFALGTDRALWHLWQTSPGKAWSGWSSLGGSLTRNPSAVANQDGRLEVFAITSDNRLWHIAQIAPNSGWPGWQTLNGSLAGDPAPVVNRDGRLEVFARGSDQALWHVWQTAPGGTWSSFGSMGGVITSNPAVLSNADGRLEAFVRGADNAVWHIAQTAPNSRWAAWASLGGAPMNGVSAAQNADGRVEVFIQRSDFTLWHIEQSVPGFWD